MTHLRRTPPRLLAAVAAAAFATGAAGLAHAHEYRAGAIEIDHPHVPAPPPGAPSVAGYLTLVNEGDEPDRLLGATARFAGGVELHSTTMDGDVARMRTLETGIEIPGGASVPLAPNGTHLMFVDPAPGLAVGDELPVTLHFERAGDAEVVFNVEDGVVPASSHEGHDMDHDMTMPDDGAGTTAHEGHDVPTSHEGHGGS